MKKTLLTTAAAAALAAVPLTALPLGAAQAQTLTIDRVIDAERYDPHRTTARAASEVLFMAADTLVALDWDMKTVVPLLAESWEVSEDGLTYTFNLRDDVSFCSGKAMTAEDVVYSINRWVADETNSPVAWRAGDVASVTAVDDYTVEYVLNAPFSELLYQLTQSFASIINEESVTALGDDFGIQGFDGTGPFCWETWEPRNRVVLTRHDAYSWGPEIYENTGPALVEEIVWRIIPEETTRMAALQTGQSDITQYIPLWAVDQLVEADNVSVTTAENYFWTYFVGFKTDKAAMDDPAVRTALNLATDQDSIVEGVWFGHAEPAYTYVHPNVLDFEQPVDESDLLTYDIERAAAILDEAGWVLNADGVREKDGVTISPIMYGLASPTAQRVAEAMQGEFRKIGVDLQVQLWDATVGWGKLATQEFDMFQMSFPYVSAGDALNLYFRSENMPTPNRMNWNDPTTDAALDAGRAALTDAERASQYGSVQEQLYGEAVWIPIAHETMFVAANESISGLKAHGIYGAGLYKALDFGKE